MPIDPYIGFKPDPKPPAPRDAVVATPAGDNEFPPDEPLKKLPDAPSEHPTTDHTDQ